MVDNPHVEHLLQRYPKAIAHMWRQAREERLGLAFGAGASLPIGIPDWKELLRRIAEHETVQGVGLIGTGRDDPLPTAAQVLYQHYRTSVLSTARSELGIGGTGANVLVEKFVQAGWKRVVHDCLYRDAPREPDDLAASDKVYQHFLQVVEHSPLTVNYNYDDSIERLLQHLRNARNVKQNGSAQLTSQRGFDAVVDSRLVFRRTTGNILHVNGYLPLNPLEAIEGPFVLNEISFEDQLVDSIGEAFATLLHYFTKHTFLFVGVSLQDENLRHLLRQNAILNPGHCHYRVQHVVDSHAAAESLALEEGHFETYNLITLFLTSGEISALGDVLTYSESQLRDLAGNLGVNLFYTYYLTGVPGAGKTTCFRHLASLVAHDEWVEERLELMSKPWVSLSAAEKETVDLWVERQVRLKNENLLDQKRSPGIGMNVIDRCPPDAVAFQRPADWSHRARRLLESIANNQEMARTVPGQVLLLIGDPAELLYRAKARDRQTSATVDFMTWLQNATKLIYTGSRGRRRGVTAVDTRGMSVRGVIKAVSKIVFLEPYVAADLHGLLRNYAKGRAKPIRTLAPSGTARRRS